MIVYLHGFNSSPHSHKARVLGQYMAERGLAAEFACPQLPASARAAARIIKDVAGSPSPCYVGSSLGGYYATYAVETWGGFIFVNLKGRDAPPLDVGSLDAQFKRYRFGELRIGKRIVADVRANWKLLGENFSECFHPLNRSSRSRPERALSSGS